MRGALIWGETEQEIWQQVIGERDWHSMEAVTDEQYDAMLADLEQETEE